MMDYPQAGYSITSLSSLYLFCTYGCSPGLNSLIKRQTSNVKQTFLKTFIYDLELHGPGTFAFSALFENVIWVCWCINLNIVWSFGPHSLGVTAMGCKKGTSQWHDFKLWNAFSTGRHCKLFTMILKHK